MTFYGSRVGLSISGHEFNEGRRISKGIRMLCSDGEWRGTKFPTWQTAKSLGSGLVSRQWSKFFLQLWALDWVASMEAILPIWTMHAEQECKSNSSYVATVAILWALDLHMAGFYLLFGSNFK